jgi:DNA-binding CsgD family transcriptional regulator
LIQTELVIPYVANLRARRGPVGYEVTKDVVHRLADGVDPDVMSRGRFPYLRSGTGSLTAAELRLLPMLSTHLTVAEIAAEMYLSRHTIKAQGRSIYRKLDASSRSQAVARARELGLLEG